MIISLRLPCGAFSQTVAVYSVGANTGSTSLTSTTVITILLSIVLKASSALKDKRIYLFFKSKVNNAPRTGGYKSSEANSSLHTILSIMCHAINAVNQTNDCEQSSLLLAFGGRVSVTFHLM